MKHTIILVLILLTGILSSCGQEASEDNIKTTQDSEDSVPEPCSIEISGEGYLESGNDLELSVILNGHCNCDDIAYFVDDSTYSMSGETVQFEEGMASVAIHSDALSLGKHIIFFRAECDGSEVHTQHGVDVGSASDIEAADYMVRTEPEQIDADSPFKLMVSIAGFPPGSIQVECKGCERVEPADGFFQVTPDPTAYEMRFLLKGMDENGEAAVMRGHTITLGHQ